MPQLSRQQRKVLATVLFLLAVGWAVKAWRMAHPPASVQPPVPKLDTERELRRSG